MEYAREGLVELEGGDRGGVVQGYTPVHSHVQLYLVQIVLVVSMCFALGQIVKRWNQPRVIAEVRSWRVVMGMGYRWGSCVLLWCCCVESCAEGVMAERWRPLPRRRKHETVCYHEEQPTAILSHRTK